MVPKTDHLDKNMTNEAYETLTMSLLFFLQVQELQDFNNV